ncbi:MAG: YfcE family phosphodiesterase [Anaerovoracaceae bacterium]|jgi:putative phosphoesterase
MKFFVISDTHGDVETAIQVYNTLAGIDRILHLGDYARDGWLLESRLGVPVTALKGNMDGSYSNEDYQLMNTEFGKIYLSHGHMEAVKYGPENLLYKASSLGCKAALYGHTHIPVFEDLGGMYLLNPGSLTHPRGGRRGSYAIVTTSAESFQATILYWDPDAQSENTGGEDKKNISSGFLRRILNDSDRR